MKTSDAVAALGALAQETRISIFRLLVRRGPVGLPAGEIASRLEVAAATLSFHLNQLAHAGLVVSRRDGRSIIYAADFSGMDRLMQFLTEQCCAEDPSCCEPLAPTKPRSRTTKEQRA